MVSLCTTSKISVRQNNKSVHRNYMILISQEKPIQHVFFTILFHLPHKVTSRGKKQKTPVKSHLQKVTITLQKPSLGCTRNKQNSTIFIN